MRVLRLFLITACLSTTTALFAQKMSPTEVVLFGEKNAPGEVASRRERVFKGGAEQSLFIALDDLSVGTKQDFIKGLALFRYGVEAEKEPLLVFGLEDSHNKLVFENLTKLRKLVFSFLEDKEKHNFENQFLYDFLVDHSSPAGHQAWSELIQDKSAFQSEALKNWYTKSLKRQDLDAFQKKCQKSLLSFHKAVGGQSLEKAITKLPSAKTADELQESLVKVKEIYELLEKADAQVLLAMLYEWQLKAVDGIEKAHKVHKDLPMKELLRSVGPLFFDPKFPENDKEFTSQFSLHYRARSMLPEILLLAQQARKQDKKLLIIVKNELAVLLDKGLQEKLKKPDFFYMKTIEAE